MCIYIHICMHICISACTCMCTYMSVTCMHACYTWPVRAMISLSLSCLVEANRTSRNPLFMGLAVVVHYFWPCLCFPCGTACLSHSSVTPLSGGWNDWSCLPFACRGLPVAWYKCLTPCRVDPMVWLQSWRAAGACMTWSLPAAPAAPAAPGKASWRNLQRRQRSRAVSSFWAFWETQEQPCDMGTAQANQDFSVLLTRTCNQPVQCLSLRIWNWYVLPLLLIMLFIMEYQSALSNMSPPSNNSDGSLHQGTGRIYPNQSILILDNISVDIALRMTNLYDDQLANLRGIHDYYIRCLVMRIKTSLTCPALW